jgi:hypothetical protein
MMRAFYLSALLYRPPAPQDAKTNETLSVSNLQCLQIEFNGMSDIEADHCNGLSAFKILILLLSCASFALLHVNKRFFSAAVHHVQQYSALG